MYQAGTRRRKRRTVTIVVVLAVVVVALVAAGGSYLLLRTHGSPAQTASAYLTAWQRAPYAARDRDRVGRPAGGLAGPLKQADTKLGLRRIHLSLGAVTTSGGSARAAFTAKADLTGGQPWTYPGALQMVTRHK